MDNTITKTIIAAVGTAATYLWGGFDAVLTALVVFACVDYATGCAAAWAGKRLSSDVGRRGIAKKVGMFFVIAVANIIDQTGGIGDPILRTASTWWYLGNESLSIIENLSEIGVPVPEKLRQALMVLRDRERRTP